jgi:hypothetical protein
METRHGESSRVPAVEDVWDVGDIGRSETLRDYGRRVRSSGRPSMLRRLVGYGTLR